MVANGQEVWRWTEAHGRRLREARVGKGMSQKKAATLLGVSDDTLRNWESGSTQPREESLAALAAFCGLPLAELVRPEPDPWHPSASSEPVQEYDPADGVRRRRIRLRLLALIIICAGIGAAVVVKFWPRTNEFKEIRGSADGVEAISRSGGILWRAAGVDPSVSEDWTFVRAPGGRTLIACVLARRGDYRPEAVSALSFIEPNAKQLQVVQRVLLPTTAWKAFPDYSRRYELAYINAVDLDHDGVDEVIATYQQVPECVSYTVLYEPVVGRARVVFVHTGAHHFTGAWDIDGDGRRELLFLGINNGYNWMNAITAIRVDPPVGAPLRPDEYAITSPDSRGYLPHESALLFYTLLPRGRVPDDPKAVSWNERSRVLSVRLLNGRVVTLTPLGFLQDPKNASSEVARSVFRREAYRRNREGRRLGRAGFAADAVAECREAVAAAKRSGDSILVEVMQRDLMKALIAEGQIKEGEALALRLASHSENASEIYYDIAVAFHLRGELRRAVAHYEAGIRRGGSPEAGKSKHEFIQGEILALAEVGAFAEAEQAVERFRARYVSGPEDWTTRYQEYLKWRAGKSPNPSRIDVPPNATDLQRYWMLEFQNANGGDPQVLLRSVDALLAEGNQPRGAILSLRAVLLDRLGRRAEAANVAREGMRETERMVAGSIIARGHMQIVALRYGLFSGNG